MGPRGSGRRLNDQERMEILEIVQREAKVKNVDLAKRYGVSEGAIRKLKQMESAVRNRYLMGNEHNRDKRKRGGFKRNAAFEQELYQWIVRMRESQPYQLMPLTGTAVRQQAVIMSKNYEKMANFKASPGWFARFCSRHQLDPSIRDAAAATAAAADDTTFLMDSLTAPVTQSQAVELVTAAAGIDPNGTEEEAKTDAPSIDEQVQQAAREHNEAALRAAAAKIGEAPTDTSTKTGEASDTESESKPKIQTKKEHGIVSAVTVADDEIFSLGL
ncbi:hypothetical protein P3T76_012421 [Phytophthora citrophthora]|uniref:HTH CENPB-type domain-containing protein n=1 Tax=Phytophthora citrophthora TaxID=4793 RepID=A0AAD9G4B5_9STRA|nr:hypothetical protein P3T76_012421 [Phytophthora citrophthora]